MHRLRPFLPHTVIGANMILITPERIAEQSKTNQLKSQQNQKNRNQQNRNKIAKNIK